MSQLRDAKAGNITEEIQSVGLDEGIPPERVRKLVTNGQVVILKNNVRDGLKPVGVGKSFRVKVNANIGTSPDCANIDEEIEKGNAAVKYGADTIMDLSIGGNLDKIRSQILSLPVPIGTVPIYQAVVESRKRGDISAITEDHIFQIIEKQAKSGVDFMTIHSGITRRVVNEMQNQDRITGIVSRGGSFLAHWMVENELENPFYSNFHEILEIAREYDVTLSLGDALRPGSIHDSTDKAQIQELIILGELIEEARKEDVQCIVEGPGHMRMNEIEANIILEKKICKGAPFYVLGPIVTDIAPGYDHITSAIGGAIAAMHGADFLCYVTPSEHLALPTVDDVRDGVIASKIAAHAADLTNQIDIELDNEMAKARVDLNWADQFRLCIDPNKAREFRSRRTPKTHNACTMCGEFCSMRILKESKK